MNTEDFQNYHIYYSYDPDNPHLSWHLWSADENNLVDVELSIIRLKNHMPELKKNGIRVYKYSEVNLNIPEKMDERILTI